MGTPKCQDCDALLTPDDDIEEGYCRTCWEEWRTSNKGNEPTCDFCGQPAEEVGENWNGETGCHRSCEDDAKARKRA